MRAKGRVHDRVATLMSEVNYTWRLMTRGTNFITRRSGRSLRSITD